MSHQYGKQDLKGLFTIGQQDRKITPTQLDSIPVTWYQWLKGMIMLTVVEFFGTEGKKEEENPTGRNYFNGNTQKPE